MSEITSQDSTESSTEKPVIEGIGQIAIAIADRKRSVDFYQNIPGLQLLFEAPPGLAFFDCGDVRLMLTTLQGDESDHNTSVIYYKVSNIDAVTKDLKSKGVIFIHEPQSIVKMEDHDLWMAFIRDPDENLIGIMAEIPFE